MWKQEKGDAGGREVRWTVCLAALKSIVQLAPFSHYTVVSVCLCVFYIEELDADIIPWPDICPCVFGGMIK